MGWVLQMHQCIPFHFSLWSWSEPSAVCDGNQIDYIHSSRCFVRREWNILHAIKWRTYLYDSHVIESSRNDVLNFTENSNKFHLPYSNSFRHFSKRNIAWLSNISLPFRGKIVYNKRVVSIHQVFFLSSFSDYFFSVQLYGYTFSNKLHVKAIHFICHVKSVMILKWKEKVYKMNLLGGKIYIKRNYLPPSFHSFRIQLLYTILWNSQLLQFYRVYTRTL